MSGMCGIERRRISPLQGLNILVDRVPRALPWAFISGPVGACFRERHTQLPSGTVRKLCLAGGYSRLKQAETGIELRALKFQTRLSGTAWPAGDSIIQRKSKREYEP